MALKDIGQAQMIQALRPGRIPAMPTRLTIRRVTRAMTNQDSKRQGSLAKVRRKAIRVSRDPKRAIFNKIAL